MTIGDQLAHHYLGIDKVLRTAETYKSNFQGKQIFEWDGSAPNQRTAISE
jgi:hypothetical protein